MSQDWDLLIVGAGPCGIAAGVAAQNEGLSCVLFDKGCITSSIIDYPYYMTFFSTAVMLEVGGIPFTIPDSKPSRREALAYYRRVVSTTGLDVRQYQEVVDIEKADDGWRVTVVRPDGGRVSHSASAVVMATGGFQGPNLLEVPGEELQKVRHYYQEPYPYFDQDVLVVGAGNSAVEAALEMYRNGVRVSLVHFLDKIDRGVKPWVVPDITNRLERGEIPVYWNHRVASVEAGSVDLRSEVDGAITTIKNDFVVAMTGWRSDHRMLRTLGVEIDAESGIPSHDPTTMETNVAGLYIAGVIAAGHNANKIFIENGRDHGGLIVRNHRSRAGR